MRAVIYARYSTDLQSPASIEDQIRICRERIKEEKGTVVEVYADYAISGGSLRNRPRMQALIAAAKKGRFDYVVAIASVAIRRMLPPSIRGYGIPTSASSPLPKARSANCT
jgi:site-specific DNA recombinase